MIKPEVMSYAGIALAPPLDCLRERERNLRLAIDAECRRSDDARRGRDLLAWRQAEHRIAELHRMLCDTQREIAATEGGSR